MSNGAVAKPCRRCGSTSACCGAAAADSAPGVADLDDLIDQTAGVRATVTRSGDLSRVPPTVGVCAYRIIQEALTNVAKHATDATVTVSVAAHDNRLEVEVTDDRFVDGRSPRLGAGHGSSACGNGCRRCAARWTPVPRGTAGGACTRCCRSMSGR